MSFLLLLRSNELTHFLKAPSAKSWPKKIVDLLFLKGINSIVTIFQTGFLVVMLIFYKLEN